MHKPTFRLLGAIRKKPSEIEVRNLLIMAGLRRSVSPSKNELVSVYIGAYFSNEGIAMIKAGKRVAIYVRVSTKDKGQSTEGQRRELERWAENAGCIVKIGRAHV